MKTTGIISALIMVVFTIFSAESQVPQGINYQSVIRNTSGSAQVSTPVILRFSILQGGDTGTPIYVETQSFTTNAQGLVAATIGQGTPVQGTFSAIDWSLGSYYLKVEANINNQGSYSVSGTSLIASVPYALFAGNASSASALASMGAKEGDVLKWNGSAWKPAVDSSNTSWGMKDGNIYTTIPGNVGIGTDVPAGKLEVKGSSSDPNVALFEVKDKNGNPIFSVYPNSVEIVFDETAPVRGAKGGFAVSGRNSTRAVVDIMRMTADSTTVYVNNLAKRGAKGGFAVSGRNSTRATGSEILRVTPDSTRIYTSDPAKGFGVGLADGVANSYLRLNRDNYFIGQESGISINGGLYNSFMGFQTGRNTVFGSRNIAIGYQSGLNNNSNDNIFIGYQSGLNSSNSFNTMIGYQSGYSNTGQANCFFGYESGFANTGWNNVFIGYKCGISSTGGANAFVGYQSGYSNTSGDYNVFLGESSGYSNTTGWSNNFIGQGAGYSNTSGTNNIFIGNDAGRLNQTTSGNTFLGRNAGYSHIVGYGNTYMGHMAAASLANGANNLILGTYAGNAKTSGDINVFVGPYAGQNNTSGDKNVFVGPHAGMNATGAANVFIGSSAGLSETGSNKLYIANSSNDTLIYGDFASKQLVINGSSINAGIGYSFWVNGQAGGNTTWASPSDLRLKKNIQTIPNALEKVMKLRGVNFEWKDETRPGINIGFIAQEVLPIVPEVVKGSEQTSFTMDYASLTAVLVEALKSQQLQIEQLKAENSKIGVLTKDNDEQKVAIDDLKARIVQLEEIVKKISSK